MLKFSNNIKDELEDTEQAEKYLLDVLKNKNEKRDYFNRITSDKAHRIYNKTFDDLTDEQEYCKSSYVDINDTIHNLIKCKKLVGKINGVLMESKKIINSKKTSKFQGMIRSSILDNRDYFEPLISPNVKDTPTEIEYKERIQDTLRLIGDEDIGDDDEEEDLGVGPSINENANEDIWNDEEDDPLYGTRGWVSRGPPVAHGIKKTRSNKNKMKKSKTIKRTKKSKTVKPTKSGKKSKKN
jgi:hypothetical protein